MEWWSIEWGTGNFLWLWVLASFGKCSSVASCLAAFFVGFSADSSSGLKARIVASVSSPVFSSEGLDDWALEISHNRIGFTVLVSSKPFIAALLFTAFFGDSPANFEVPPVAGLITSATGSTYPALLKNLMVLSSSVLSASETVLLGDNYCK
jgi:hypothetical protein